MEELILAKLRFYGYNATRNSIIIYKLVEEKRCFKNISEIEDVINDSYLLLSSSSIRNIIVRLFNIGLLTFEQNIEGRISNIKVKN